jgi:hypothetical protein
MARTRGCHSRPRRDLIIKSNIKPISPTRTGFRLERLCRAMMRRNRLMFRPAGTVVSIGCSWNKNRPQQIPPRVVIYCDEHRSYFPRFAMRSFSRKLKFVFLVAACVTVALACAVPGFIHARLMAASNCCICNLRLIDSAEQQWGLERHKSTNDIPTWDDLRPYLGSEKNFPLPVCPNGGTYRLGRLEEKPKCSFPGHTLP